MPRIPRGPRKDRSASPKEVSRGAWEPRLRLWVAIDGRDAFGPGKMRLLEAVAVTRSLSEAAKQLRMSYRLAWKHLDILEERTGIAVVEPQRGGRGGGGTDLTPAGRALLEAYGRFRRDVEEHVDSACRRFFDAWLPNDPGKGREAGDGENESIGPDEQEPKHGEP